MPKTYATPAGRVRSLPSPELVSVVDRLLSPTTPQRINRIIDMFKWGTRPKVPTDIGAQVLQSICTSNAYRYVPEGFSLVDATGIPERMGCPEKRVLDRRTATLQACQYMLDEQSFYDNKPIAMDARIALLLYPRCCAAIMSMSSGYASPIVAARILTAAVTKSDACCEWVASCYPPRGKFDTRTNNERCVSNALGHLARKAGRVKGGFYGGYHDKFLLILHELLVEGGVPCSVDYVGRA